MVLVLKVVQTMVMMEQGPSVEGMQNYSNNIVDLMALADCVTRRPETSQTVNWAGAPGTKPVTVGLNGLLLDRAELPSYEGSDRV